MRTPTDAEQIALQDALTYDPETGDLRWLESRRKVRAGALAGSIHRDGSLVLGFQGRVYQAHHVAWFLHHGDWPGGPLAFRDGNPLNLRASNVHPLMFANTRRARQMRRYRARKAPKLPPIPMSKQLGVHISVDGVWVVRASWSPDPRVIMGTFRTQKEAETFAALCQAGYEYIRDNPAEALDPVQAATRAPGEVTLAEAEALLAYDPRVGAIYKRAPDLALGTPVIEIDPRTRRPIVRLKGRTYSAGMMAWFLYHGEWPKRRRLGYRDGNRKNTAIANLYLKGSEQDAPH
jgi:hypothetical protein